MAETLGRLGTSDATLGRATRHLLLSPSDPVDSEAALRATDAYLLLGWEGVQRLALGLLLDVGRQLGLVAGGVLHDGASARRLLESSSRADER